MKIHNQLCSFLFITLVTPFTMADEMNETQYLCTGLRYALSSRIESINEPSKEALRALEWIAERVGIKPNFTLQAATFKEGRSPMAYATIKDGERYIAYDQERLFLSKEGTLTWQDLSMLAHELTHHTSGATIGTIENQHQGELEADRGSAYILQQIGATLEQALIWTDMLPEKGSQSHPGRAERRNAVIEAWQDSKSLPISLQQVDQ